MRFSISNIAWPKEWDEEIYSKMIQLGYTGLEIAPTRIFPDNPYENKKRVSAWYKKINDRFEIPSMQSIWNGRPEKIFGSQEERDILIDYTKKAIDFAEIIHCRNLVFGCPRNRNNSEMLSYDVAVTFFKAIGDYALKHNTAIGIEANPPIYNTNFLNTTKETMNFIEHVNSKGFLLNLDIGTMIHNNEEIEILDNQMHLVNHIHISEPGLKRIVKRDIHKKLRQAVRENIYDRYISVEMAKQDSVEDIVEVMKYIIYTVGD